VIDYIVGYERHLEAAEYFDEAHVRALVEQIVDRTNDVAASVMNHALAEEGELARSCRGAGPRDSRCRATAPGGRRPSAAAAAVVDVRHRGHAAAHVWLA
jgi:hypothetical protein